MPAGPFEPDGGARAPAGDAEQPEDAKRRVRARARASGDGDEDGQRPEEPPDEPGYGHGV